MRAWWVCALLLVCVMPGCSESGGGDGPGDGTSTRTDSPTATTTTSGTRVTGTATTTTTASGDGGDNRAPTASLVADIPGGSPPFNVTFTVDGEDQDGDDLAWELDFGDGERETGEGVPSSVIHGYESGVYDVLLTVSDGVDASTQTLEVNATGDEEVILTGHVVLVNPAAAAGEACALQGAFTDAGAPSDIAGGRHELDPSVWGWTYAFAAEGFFADFYDADLNPLGAGSSGTVPEDTAEVLVCGGGEGAVDADYALTLAP